MKKQEQLIKELQMLVGNAELNDIIEEKMIDMWRDARRDCDSEWVKRQEDFNKRQIERETNINLQKYFKVKTGIFQIDKALNYSNIFQS